MLSTSIIGLLRLSIIHDVGLELQGSGFRLEINLPTESKLLLESTLKSATKVFTHPPYAHQTHRTSLATQVYQLCMDMISRLSTSIVKGADSLCAANVCHEQGQPACYAGSDANSPRRSLSRSRVQRDDESLESHLRYVHAQCLHDLPNRCIGSRCQIRVYLVPHENSHSIHRVTSRRTALVLQPDSTCLALVGGSGYTE
jgi:hypothetical protein